LNSSKIASISSGVNIGSMTRLVLARHAVIRGIIVMENRIPAALFRFLFVLFVGGAWACGNAGASEISRASDSATDRDDGRRSLSIARQGGFMVGGRTTTFDNETYRIEGTFVGFQIPTERHCLYPMVMVHGNFGTAAVWDTTPDGREGFQTRFLRRGCSTYVPDLVFRGRAGWVRPGIWSGETIVFPTAESIWPLFRLGPSYPIIFPGVQFPIDKFDTYLLQAVPSWQGGTGSPNAVRLARAMQQVAENVGPNILLTHSQSGRFAWELAGTLPNLVGALVQLEPIGASVSLSDSQIVNLAKIPILIIYGDFVEKSSRWVDEWNANRTIAARVEAAGGDVTFVDLPALGIHGSSHMLMMDRTSASVENVIYCWMLSKGLVRSGDDNKCGEAPPNDTDQSSSPR
jgi:pimeloyl-ACP methyl ester carboxylesterase